MSSSPPASAPSPEGPLLIVVGMTREARIAAPLGRVVIGAAGLREALSAAGSRRPRGILSFGVCGGLDPALKVGDLLVADAVSAEGARLSTDFGWRVALREALAGAHDGDMAGGAVIVDSPAAKAALRRASGAVAVDMESHAVARAAVDADIPFAVLRAVSDAAEHALPRAAQAGFREDGEPDIGAVIAGLARRPWELPALIRVGRDAEAGFRALSRAVAALTRDGTWSA